MLSGPHVEHNQCKCNEKCLHLSLPGDGQPPCFRLFPTLYVGMLNAPYHEIGGPDLETCKLFFFCNCQEKRRYTTKKPEAPQEKKSWSLHLQAPDQRDSVESWACRPRKSEGLTEDGEGEKRNEAKRWNLLLVDTRVLRKRGVTACLWKATGIRNTWYCTNAQIFWRDPPKLGLI